MTELKEVYKTEYDFINKNYPNVSEYTKIDYLKQILDYYDKVKRKRYTLKNIPLGWNTEIFKTHILDEIEYDNFMENPLGGEMTDSVVSCSKCKSSKTFNIEKQTRSLDEPTTIITICFDCKHRQKYSG